MILAIRIMADPRTVSATVVELRPHDHRTVVISYELEGKEYKVSTVQPDVLGLPKYDDLSPGDQVFVTYNPKRPDKGIPGSARKLLWSEGTDLLGFSGFGVLLAFISEMRIRKYGFFR